MWDTDSFCSEKIDAFYFEIATRGEFSVNIRNKKRKGRYYLGNMLFFCLYHHHPKEQP